MGIMENPHKIICLLHHNLPTVVLVTVTGMPRERSIKTSIAQVCYTARLKADFKVAVLAISCQSVL